MHSEIGSNSNTSTNYFKIKTQKEGFNRSILTSIITLNKPNDDSEKYFFFN